MEHHQNQTHHRHGGVVAPNLAAPLQAWQAPPPATQVRQHALTVWLEGVNMTHGTTHLANMAATV